MNWMENVDDRREDVAILRADLAELRQEMQAGFAQLREEMQSRETAARMELMDAKFEVLKWSLVFSVTAAYVIAILAGVLRNL